MRALVTLFKHVGVADSFAIPRNRAHSLMGARMGRTTSLAGALAVLTLGLVLATWACLASAPVMASARAARTLNATDEAHLHLTGTSGSLFSEEGPAKGALPGTVKVRFTVTATVSGSFTIYPRGGGSISGHGSARLHSTGTYASFGGSMSVSHGTGRYAHAHGSGGFYGVLDRRTDALTIQTTGKLSY
jgi:hypothetical protein